MLFPQQRLLLEEYKMLRGRTRYVLERLERLEQNVLIACSAIYVFALSEFRPTDHEQRAIVYLLPSIVSIFGFFRYYALSGYLKEINYYTMELERKTEGLGWLNHYYSQKKLDVYYESRVWVWVFLVLLNLLAAIILIWPPSSR